MLACVRAGHFMLAPAHPDMELLIDPQNGGEVLFLQDAADKLASVHGVQVAPPPPPPPNRSAMHTPSTPSYTHRAKPRLLCLARSERPHLRRWCGQCRRCHIGPPQPQSGV